MYLKIKGDIAREYARRFVDIELRASLRERPRPEGHAPVVDFFCSTANRRLVRMLLCKSALNNEPGVLPSSIAKTVGISRNAVDAILADAEALNFVTITRDSRGYRRVRCTDLVTEVYIGYTSWIMGEVQASGILNLHAISAENAN